MAYNNKEFQEHLDTFDEPSKYRDLLWDTWVEATSVAEEKSTSTKTGSPKLPNLEEVKNKMMDMDWDGYDIVSAEAGVNRCYDYIYRLLLAGA